MGGLEEFIGASIDLQEGDTECSHWELQTHALLVCLVGRSIITVDELRRGVEGLPEDTYRDWGYYGKWAASMATGKGVLSLRTRDPRLEVILVHFDCTCLFAAYSPTARNAPHSSILTLPYLCNAPV